MKTKEFELYNDGVHKCIMFSLDDEEYENNYLSLNQYLIIQKDEGILIDPGSSSLFYDLKDAVEKHIDLNKIKYIFFSHQDPDVAGSITEWNISAPSTFIVSKIWIRFMSHYGFMNTEKIIPLNDKGAKINFGSDFLHFIPAHFLHSPGNFSLYDSRSKILFSGDIGASIKEPNEDEISVSDFEEHKTFLESFHKRYMASNEIARKWVNKVKKYDINIIAPQHGSLFKDIHVENFLNWFEEFKCGSDYLDELYGK